MRFSESIPCDSCQQSSVSGPTLRLAMVVMALIALGLPETVPAGTTADPAAGVPIRKGRGQGSDLEIGGFGTGHGTFNVLSDFTFDDRNRLCVLDGARFDKPTKSLVGNHLVQWFENDGKFISEFSIRAEALGNNDQPARLAVDGAGNVYITQPLAGLVQQYGTDGKLVHTFEIPGAYAIARRTVGGKDQIVVAANLNKRPKDRLVVGELAVIESGSLGSPVKLDHPISGATFATADRQGNLYFLADTNQIYKFDPNGKLLAVLGGGTEQRLEDGSELLYTVAVDSKGFVYAMPPGNPAKVTRFTPDLTQLAQRPGRFSFFDPWSGYTPFAIDRSDRLWVGTGVIRVPDPTRYHFRPCVLRVVQDFFDPKPGVTESSALKLGLSAEIQTKLPYNVGNELALTPIDFVISAAIRRVDAVSVSYHIYDVWKNEAAHGSFDMPLQNGVEARQSLSFTPPKWGIYAAEFTIAQKGGQTLTTQCAYLGFTPKFPGMPTLAEGDSKGGWNDTARQAFCGLHLFRVHPTARDLDKIEKDVDAANQRGLTVLAQLSSLTECNAAFAATAVTRLKGKVKYWEVFNEPNLQMTPDKYVPVLEETAKAIKAADPAALVMGPTVCGINLEWYTQFYELGGGKLCDILSIHDYEGNEGIDPYFWPWKIGELRKIMAAHGDADKPIWQTERAVCGVIVFIYLGGMQAVRVTLHNDLLETLGIPNEHNLHYYLNQGGYTSVPSWIWDKAGPYPAALAMRTRAAMILGRTYTGQIDLGPTGKRIFLALKYKDATGSTITFRNLGTLDTPLTLNVSPGESVECVDAFGNAQSLPVRDGKLALLATALPQYLRLAPGQEVSAAPIDFGRNIAAEATASYSAGTKSSYSALANGILESSHFQDPFHDQHWVGDFPGEPQTLEFTFPQPRTIGRMLVFSMNADNAYCALLDYDLQYNDGTKWVTIEKVRTPCPVTDVASSGVAVANAWYLDTNFFVHEFAPVTTRQLRLVVYRTSFGAFPDRASLDVRHKVVESKLMLREVEIYEATPDVRIEADEFIARTQGPAPQTVGFRVLNQSAKPVRGSLTLEAPAGWKVSPSQIPVDLAPGAASSASSFALQLPDPTLAGMVPLDLQLCDSAAKRIDDRRVFLNVQAPVALSPKAAPRSATEPTLALALKNLTGEPVEGTLELTLTPVWTRPGLKPIVVRQPIEPLKPHAGASATVPLTADLSVSPWTASWTVIANHVGCQIEQPLAQHRQWSVIGPFPNESGQGFDAVYEPEEHLDLAKTYLDPNGKPLHWQPAGCDPSGLIDLLPLMRPNNDVCAYAVQYVKSPTDRHAVVWAGADDGVKIWVNGKLAYGRAATGATGPRQDRVEVELKAGWNQVLLKITQGNGGWGYFFDLAGADGRSMDDLSYAAVPGP